MRASNHYETDSALAGTARVRGFEGFACRVLGWETEPVAVWLCPDCDYCAHEREHGGGKVIDPGDATCEHEHSYQSDEPEHERTGRVLIRMVGDDGVHSVERADLTYLDRKDYCGVCGQIGCAHDGLDRTEEEEEDE